MPDIATPEQLPEGAHHSIGNTARPGLAVDGLAIVTLALLPLYASSYWIYALALAFANAVGVLAITVLIRYGGEVSIGHNLFVALGAYSLAVATVKLGWPVLIAGFLAVALSVAAAVVFSFPSRRLSGIYLAVATMALGLAVPEIALHFGAVTGGYEGLYVKPDLLQLFDPTIERYYLALLALGLIVAALRRFRNSRQGIALLLVCHSPLAAESFGTRTSWARTSVMAISGGLGGISGVLLTLVSTSISPSNVTFWSAIYLLVGAVVSLYGLSLIAALAGAAFITLIPEVLSDRGQWVQIIYGIALLAAIMLSNARGSISDLVRQRRARRAAGNGPR